MLRVSRLCRGPATSNMFAPPASGRWFNPPHTWAWSDFTIPLATFCGAPMWLVCYLYLQAYAPHYSHYQEKNYYPTLPYTKEFLHKYKRMERWRHY